MLSDMPDVTELHLVPEAHVPMMKFKLNGVSIYLLYAKLSLWVIPEPAASDFIVRDTGNCRPRYMRCTINQIPCTSDLLNTSGMQLALLVKPLALPHPSEEPIQIVDFREGGPVCCSCCKGYIKLLTLGASTVMMGSFFSKNY
ncbi:unnamed protein product [Lactuca virosa]|uniref:Poly(A) polymerase nucleotidyltransferase domain-containing protein n=1 Tax=Lactuca virosa TaxID=75947 RepID=A0AAU9M6Y2_9ASTR|nr:unnamed protein product [Lactuca virosa]